MPIRVEYSTTEMADRLMPILEELSDWGEEMMKTDVPAGGHGSEEADR